MGPAPDVSFFIELLAHLPDPRIERSRRHSLEAILFLYLCGVICGANDLVAIEAFGKARRAFLDKFVEFPHGIPSHDTLGRVLAKLNPTALEKLFTKWMHGVAEATRQDVVAIDGKTLRRALDKASGCGLLTMVSAWSTANGVVLGQVGTDVGSNEVAAIPYLLELLHLRGCLVTIDAAGCQTSIATQIVHAGGDYLLAVRENQPKLHAAVRARFEAAVSEPDASDSDVFAMTYQTSRGRKETRKCWVLEAGDSFSEASRWEGLSVLVRFDSERTVGGKTTKGSRLFITSRKGLTAQ